MLKCAGDPKGVCPLASKYQYIVMKKAIGEDIKTVHDNSSVPLLTMEGSAIALEKKLKIELS